MGREMKRVPINFDYPLHEVWKGYFLENAKASDYVKFPVKSCDECREKHGDCREEADYCVYYNPKWRKLWHEEPPEGEGYQLWETTSEGSPITPVFETLDELCEYAESHCHTFGNFKTTKEEWKKMILDQCIYAKDKNYIFI